MGINRNEIDKAKLADDYWKKRYQDVLDELRRQSANETANNLAGIEGSIKKHSGRYDQAFAEFSQIVKDRQRQLGMESYSTLILQMKPSLEAFSKMAEEYKMYIGMKIWHGIRSNINARDFTLLAIPAEVLRNVRAGIDFYCGTEGNFAEDLPPLFVPYLAEVNEKGVLSVNLDVPNTQMTEQSKRKFVDQYGADFEASITAWINGSLTPEGEPMAVRDTPEGRKIIINPGAAERVMTSEEFSAFRINTIEPALEDHFGVDFQPETPRNMSPGQ